MAWSFPGIPGRLIIPQFYNRLIYNVFSLKKIKKISVACVREPAAKTLVPDKASP